MAITFDPIPRLGDRVMEVTTTQGTGPYVLGGALPGYQRFAADGIVSVQTYYCAFAVDSNGVPTGAWELGRGTVDAGGTTLTRDTITKTSNGRDGNPIDWLPGTRRIMAVLPVEAIERIPGTQSSIGFDPTDFSANQGSWTVTSEAVLYNRINVSDGVTAWQIYLSWFGSAGSNVVAGAPTQLKIRLASNGGRYYGPASALSYSTVPGLYVAFNGDGWAYLVKADGSAFADGPVGFFGVVMIF